MTKILDVPWDGPRMESGPVRFGDDWAGTFMRGDESLVYGYLLQRLLDGDAIPAIDRVTLRNLATILITCDERSTYKDQQKPKGGNANEHSNGKAARTQHSR